MTALVALILAASPFADLVAIDREVAVFTGASTGASGGAALPVDRRLRLRPCLSPLSLGWRTPRQESVVVECPDLGGWRLFVPVRQADAGQTSAVAVNRGDAVTIAVTGDGFTVSQPGEALETGPVGGWVRVRAVNGKGQPMRARIVRPGMVALPLP
ncbi:MAG: flagella basal body P-ring formation protein FlgA [Novosphingobium sp.]